MMRTMATRCTGPNDSPSSATPSSTPTTGLTSREHEATGDDLPCGRGDDVDRRGPLLGEDEAARRDEDGEQSGPGAHRVDGSVEAVLEHEQAHAEEADHTGRQRDPGRAVTDEQPGDGHRHHRCGSDEGGP